MTEESQPVLSTDKSPHKLQSGFSMIEVLVTVFIIAIGLLGIAAVQFMSKRTNFEAVQRTTATILAHDLIERMRANKGQLIEYAGDATGGTTLGGPTATLTTPSVNCISASCTPFELSQFDLWEWETLLNGVSEQDSGNNKLGGLVAPTACITTTVGAGVTNRSGPYIVAIAWRGATALSNPASSTCGAGSGKYNDESGGVDTHRRVLVINTFISTQ